LISLRSICRAKARASQRKLRPVDKLNLGTQVVLRVVDLRVLRLCPDSSSVTLPCGTQCLAARGCPCAGRSSGPQDRGRLGGDGPPGLPDWQSRCQFMLTCFTPSRGHGPFGCPLRVASARSGCVWLTSVPCFVCGAPSLQVEVVATPDESKLGDY
jgi:hypothetical protein